MDVYFIAALVGILANALGLIDRIRAWMGKRAPRTHGHKTKGRR